MCSNEPETAGDSLLFIFSLHSNLSIKERFVGIQSKVFIILFIRGKCFHDLRRKLELCKNIAFPHVNEGRASADS